MKAAKISKHFGAALALAALALGGCGVVGVEMTSSPEVVKKGDPVTFDVKLTNYSACPVESAVAIIVPFISLAEIEREFNPILTEPDVPPEIIEFLAELRAFLDSLCTGGAPVLPTPPSLATAGTRARGLNAGCELGEGQVECEITGFVGGTGSSTFDLFSDQLHCNVNDGFMRCNFGVALPQGETPSGAPAAIQNLTCLTAADLGIPGDSEEFEAFCFIGSFPAFMGLGGGQMAQGSIALPARGAGVVRNFVIVISDDSEELGVCKGGANVGQACNLDDSSPCPGSSCGSGVCVGGDNPGVGCDVAGDCPNGTCTRCDDVPEDTFLPIDCTTTIISPETAPAMSTWGLASMAVLLFAIGAFLLQRRGRRA